MSKKNPFLEGPILRSLIAVAIPIVIANILQAAYQMIDAFWVGRLGADAVASVSVSVPFTFLTISLGAGLAIAGSTLIAQYVGAKNQKMVDHVAGQTILMIVLSSIALGAIGFMLAPFFLKLVGVTPEVYEGALIFMRISFIGLIFNFSFAMFQSIMRGIGNTILPVYIVFGTVCLSFFIVPVFLFGWGPIPAMGIMGAALATMVTQSIAAIVGMVILFSGKQGISLRLKNLVPDFGYIKKAFFLGFPSSIEMSMRALSLTVMTFLITSFGTLAVASYGVGSNILQVVMIPAMGLSMAISVMVGQNIGAGNIERAARVGRVGAWLGFWVLEVLGVIAFLFAPHLVSFFVPGSPEVIAEGSVFIRTMALAWGFIGVQMALSGVLRASGSMVITMVLTIISQWVLQFPLAYILSKHTTLGVEGIWWAFPVANAIIAVVTIAVFMKGDWKKNRLTKEDKLEEKISEEIMADEAYLTH